MSDPVHSHYRTKEEVEEQKQHDPISLFQTYLLEKKILSKKMIDEIEGEIKKEVMDSVKFAEESPLPPLEARFEDVYA